VISASANIGPKPGEYCIDEAILSVLADRVVVPFKFPRSCKSNTDGVAFEYGKT
jgi:molybdopterin biosynthesis enzyme